MAVPVLLTCGYHVRVDIAHGLCGADAVASPPRVPDVVAELRAEGADRVVIAAYLLADGLFYRSLLRAGADAVTAPLGTDPAVADLVLRRYDAAKRLLSSAA